MILCDESIRKALAFGDIEIDPPPKDDQYQTSAVDIFLGDSFRIWDPARFGVGGVRLELNLAEQKFQATANAFTIQAPRETDNTVVLPPYYIEPRVLLCLTRERIHLKMHAGLAARVEGRSSLARSGLIVHLTAPTIHAGFNGQITLEIINHGPFYMKFVPNKTRICQLIIEKLDNAPSGELQTVFQGQTTPIGPSGKKG